MNYINRILMTLIAMTVSSAAYPCAHFCYTKDYIRLFRVSEEAPDQDKTMRENLRLWRQETSADIPLADIKEIVYGPFSAETWKESMVADTIRSNKFYSWIRSHKATDVQEFLTIAKRVERLRAERCSPWYYPAHKSSAGNNDTFASLIECCSAHKDGRLKARYGLQLIRLLHASCLYEECLTEFHKWFDDVPDNHLMKRMAMDYVAGAWTRLGDVDKANKYFAMKGDVNSLNRVDALTYMAEVNPSGYPMKVLENHLGNFETIDNYSDEHVKTRILPIVSKVVKESKAKNIGEWEYLMAYLQGEYNEDYEEANKYIHSALAHGLPTQTGRDYARAYKMAIDGARGNTDSLLSDLKWIEEKVRNEDYNLEIGDWYGIMVAIVYSYWFSYLTEHDQLSMAMLLGNYAEHLYIYSEIERDRKDSLSAQEKAQMRQSRDERSIDFNGIVYEFMMTRRAHELINYKHFLNSNSKLIAYLRDEGRNDDDYLNEMIGTLYLQECNYAEAIEWLSKVSPDYQYTLNTYKDGFLARNPFAFTKEGGPVLKDKENIKLNFAKEMYSIERQMRFADDRNERAVAKVKYTLGRYASFSTCWALTAYQKGFLYKPHRFYPDIAINKGKPREGYCCITTVEPRWEREALEESRMHDEIEKILSGHYDKETEAEIHYLLGNLKTVAKRYPDTSIGQFLSEHCDHWKDWI